MAQDSPGVGQSTTTGRIGGPHMATNCPGLLNYLWRGTGLQEAPTRGVSQSFGVYGSLSLRAVSAPPNRRGPMILSAIAEKLKRRAKDGLKGRHFRRAP